MCAKVHYSWQAVQTGELRFIFMAGGALFDINSPLGGVPAAADRPDPGTQLVSAWIDLPQPVAFDTERTILMASGALAPAGPHL